MRSTERLSVTNQQELGRVRFPTLTRDSDNRNNRNIDRNDVAVLFLPVTIKGILNDTNISRANKQATNLVPHSVRWGISQVEGAFLFKLKKETPWLLVRKRNIPNERPQPVGKF
jgi:hypothetical protein